MRSCTARWASRGKHRGTAHECVHPDGHLGRHECSCGQRSWWYRFDHKPVHA